MDNRGKTTRVAVIGGGISGLATSYFLLQQGYQPVLLEAADQLGGLGTYFEHQGARLDRFYHVIVHSDADLRGLIDELGLADRVVWRATGMGFFLGGRHYAFNTPLDILRFGALPLRDRLRTGLGALCVTKLARDGHALDQVTARQWLHARFGRRVYERIWGPLLRAKFGSHCDGVPAYWVWKRLKREKNGGSEIKGYLQGGYDTLAQALGRAIVAGGGAVRLRAPVTALRATAAGALVTSAGVDEHYDAAVSTLPLPLLATVARGSLARQVPLPDLHYQGVVNAVVVTRKPLGRFYWTIAAHPAVRFQGVVETTQIIPPGWVGGRHLLYLMNYCDADSETYARPEPEVRHQAVDGLRLLYPHFDPAAVEATYVFRAPHVEPVWSVGYLQQRPAPRIADTRVYLSTSAQAYPRVNAWDTCVQIARDTAAALARDLPAARASEYRAAAAA